MKLSEKWQKVVEQNGEYVFNKVLAENEKCVFYFYFKIEGTFWPAQYIMPVTLQGPKYPVSSTNASFKSVSLTSTNP